MQCILYIIWIISNYTNRPVDFGDVSVVTTALPPSTTIANQYLPLQKCNKQVNSSFLLLKEECLPHFFAFGLAFGKHCSLSLQTIFFAGSAKTNLFSTLLTVPLRFFVGQKNPSLLLSTLICSELFFVQQKISKATVNTARFFVRCPFKRFLFSELCWLSL
jgi:hypothetical protein